MEQSLRRLQLVEFDILKQVKKICEQHQLTYYLSGGTLIGAVRHKGFIPWDDDIDIAMPRPDYEKFLVFAEEELPEPLVLSTRKTGSIAPFAQVQNKSIYVRSTSRKNEQIWPAWIDIFPLDAMPNEKVHFFFRKYHLLYRRMMFQLSVFDDYVSINKKSRPWYEKVIIWIATKMHPDHFLNADKQCSKFHKALAAYPFTKGKYVINMLGMYKFKSVMEKEIYGRKTELSFEGEPFSVPEQYDAYLRRIYGDYMQVPPENERNHHETEIIEN